LLTRIVRKQLDRKLMDIVKIKRSFNSRLVALIAFGCLINSLINSPIDAQSLETSIDYAQVNDLLMIVSVKARSKYVFAKSTLELKNKNLTFSDIQILLKRNDELIEDIGIGIDGAISLPVIPEDQMEGVTLSINQKKNDATISINFGIHPPVEKTLKYSELFIVLKDVNEFMADMAGIASWFIRDKVALKFKFDQAASIYVKSVKKDYHYETDEDLNIVIKIKRGLLKEDPDIVFSHLPAAIGI